MDAFMLNLEVKTDRPHDFRDNGIEIENIGIFTNLPYHRKDLFNLVYSKLNYYIGTDDVAHMVSMVTEQCKENRNRISVLSTAWFDSNCFRHVSVRLTIRKYKMKTFSETKFPSGIL